MATDIIARLQLRGEQFSSENSRLFAELERRSKDAAERTRSSFERSFADIQRLTRDALASPRTDSGSLNVGADRYREAAAAARNQATALREVEAAARRAADATADTSQETRLYLQAASAAAREAEENARALTQEANALDRLQAELNRTTSQTTSLANAQQRNSRESRNNQLAMRNLGFQVSDVGASLVSGSSLFVVFGQQIGQVGGALSDMTGKLGVVGRFLTNPWVAAITTAVIVVGMFVDKLGEAKEAADLAKLGSDGLADAQGVLGKMFDLTSGRIEHQNSLLRLNAQLTAINLRAEAEKDREDAQKAFASADNADWSNSVASLAQRVTGVKTEGLVANSQDRVRSLLDDYRSGKLSAEAAAKAVEGIDLNGLSIKKSDLLSAISKDASVGVKRGIADMIESSLKSGILDPGLRRDDSRKPKDMTRAIAARDEFGRDALDRIAGISDQFGGAPSQIVQAKRAMRELDDIMDDLARRKPPGFQATIASAREAKQVVQDSLIRPYNEFLRAQRENAEVGKLLVNGRTAEAEALSNIYRLQQQMGPLTYEQLAAVRAAANENERIARAMEDQRRQIGIYVQAVGDAQRTFEDFLFSLERKPGEAFKNLGKGLRDTFKNLQVRIISEQLFGGLDREIADFINGATGPQAAIDVLAKEANRAGSAMDYFATEAEKVAARLAGDGAAPGISFGGGRSIVAGDSTSGAPIDAINAVLRTLGRAPIDVSGQDNEPSDIVVVGARKAADQMERAGVAQSRAAKQLLSASSAFDIISQRLAERLEALLGSKGLAGALSGALGGYATAGPVGAVLGGLKGAGIGKLFGKQFGDQVSKGLTNALAGAQTGSLVAGLGKSLGLKMSTTGSQIGGALGGATGIPGADIVGSVIGGAIGGIFKKTPRGYATIGDANGTLGIVATGGNKASAKAAGVSAADDTVSMLNRIAEALGGSYDPSRGSVSIGQSGDSWHVDTTGRGRLKKSQGGYDFNQDYEAAVRFATMDLIKDGVIVGISDAAKRILQSGKDLETAIEKAASIEAIPKLLKQRLDPLGAALDDLDVKWQKQIAILKEGGATAAQMAQAQQLYNLELADVKANTPGAAQALKEFRESLMMGGDSPLSLRDQEEMAKAKLQPYLDVISAGGSVDQDAYVQAAQSFLDIERQLYGSTSQFFEAFDRINAATAKAIDKIDNAVAIRPETDLFAKATASASQSTASNTATANDILAQISNGQADVAALLRQILGGGGGSSKIGADGRLFVKAV
ncbi:MAG: hypothetical protein QHC65_16280 [Sphingomonas sp.]|nr:hypothetical protein [Sphingomonas sp.]MDX3885982.1 hypothetical protein [Sphingomonas sp.]